MKKKQIEAIIYQYTLVIIILTAIAYRGGRDFIFKKNKADIVINLQDVQKIFPSTAYYSLNRPGVFDPFNSNREKIGSILLTSEFSEEFGYGGIVPLLIGLDNEMIITKIVLLPNHETSDYIAAIESDNFIGRWKGVKLEDAIKLEVDVVSGATHTSLAVRSGIKKTASRLMESDASFITETSLWSTLEDVLFLCIILTSLVVAFKKGTAKYRRIYLIFVLLIMGVILNNTLSAQLLHGWLIDGFTWRANWQSIILLLLAWIISFIGKRKFYCNYLCPMGALQELTNHFTPFKKRHLKTNYKAFSLRELYLAFIACALLLGFTPELSYFEPFMFFSFRIAGFGLIIFGLAIVFLSLFITKPWCALCPTGCIVDTISFQKAKNNES